MFREIWTLPRRLLAELDPPMPYVVASVTDPPPDGEPAKVPQRWGLRDVLRLEFHDFDPPRHCPWAEYPSRLAIGPEAETNLIGVLAMRCEQAQQFAVWATGWHTRDVPLLVIHCEAGVSRSVAMGLAAVEAFGAMMSPRTGNGGTLPRPERATNQWVYWITKHALRDATGGKS